MSVISFHCTSNPQNTQDLLLCSPQSLQAQNVTESGGGGEDDKGRGGER